jgi:hypothetical protein
MSDEDKYCFSTRDLALGTPPKEWGTAIWLRLERYGDHMGAGGLDARLPVLLLHGGSANHGTFTIPDGGLAGWLFDRGFDPWLLDWRGSSLVVDNPKNEHTLTDESDLYTFNRAALEDLPAATKKMRSLGVHGPIAAVGHCMGAAVIAEAVALGHTTGAIDRIVLLALGLFYEAPIDSRLKSEERILERLTHAVYAVPSIDPRMDASGRVRWPPDLSNLYDAWPRALRAHEDGASDVVGSLCNRLSFMYGMPYRHENLPDSIHGSASGPAELPNQFGAFPLKMYLHAARNLRRGQATFFDPTQMFEGAADDDRFVSDGARERFRALTNVTLITGALNRLWHRDSIDRMHEWLCRGSSRSLRMLRKHVLPTYGHQDLLWGRDSACDVYRLIRDGLDATSLPSHSSSPFASAP